VVHRAHLVHDDDQLQLLRRRDVGAEEQVGKQREAPAHFADGGAAQGDDHDRGGSDQPQRARPPRRDRIPHAEADVQQATHVAHRLGPQRPRERRRRRVEIVVRQQVHVFDQVRLAEKRQQRGGGDHGQREGGADDREPATGEQRRHGDNGERRLRRQRPDDDRRPQQRAPGQARPAVQAPQRRERDGRQDRGLTERPARQRDRADERRGDGQREPVER